jgi:uncharacterized protein YdhG (YjbR/CyaY superfamily)
VGLGPHGAEVFVKASSVDAYLEALPEDQRKALQLLREQIHAAAPGVVECISYGMPGFKLKKMLVWFGAAKNHCAFYPKAIPAQFLPQLSGFDTSRGTIRFQPEHPLPPDLIEALVRFRVAEDGR